MTPGLEIMSAKQFLALQQQSPEAIKAAKFVPPTLGKKGFGHFIVEIENPSSARAIMRKLLAGLR